MPVKFDQYWTIIAERDQEYRNFILKDFIPGINRLGIHTVAGWAILVGSYAEILFEGVANDLDLIEKALTDPKYKELKDKLLNYVKDYKTKVLIPTGRKNAYSANIKENTVKFSQMWNIRFDKRKDYERFVDEKFYPILEELDISVAGEWEVLIGDGPHTICEGRTQNIDRLMHNLQSEKFQHARSELNKYVENYCNRFLSFHIKKNKGYKSESYHLIS
ncbi:hypothetical protein ACFLZT_02990 [Thermodesulfobacteriota bacterium]